MPTKGRVIAHPSQRRAEVGDQEAGTSWAEKMVGLPWVASRRWVFGLVIVLSLPTLGMGFMMDDYAQLALVESWYPSNAGVLDLYEFLDRLPYDPWWKHPELKVRMWRPLPSVLLRLDNLLFGSWAVGYHLQSLLWYFALLWVCSRLYQRWLGGGLAVLALLIFALDECHLLTAAWIANRHSMVAMVPALLGLSAHLRWREERWRPGLPLSLLGYGIGLMGGEMALGVMAYGVAYELLAAPRGRRLVAGLPLVLLGMAYALAYKAMDFGAAHSGFYLDPLGDPPAFVRAAAGHLPALLAAALAGLPSDLWFFVPRIRGGQIALGLLALVGVGWLLVLAWPSLARHERRMLRWMVGGALFSLLPVAAAQPFDRVLIVPMFGLAALIAVLARWLWHRRGRARWKRSTALLLVVFAGLHLATPIATRVVGQWLMDRQWTAVHQLAMELPIAPQAAPHSDVIVLSAPDIVLGGFLPLIYGFEHRLYFRSWQILSLAPFGHRLHRTGPRTLELEVLEGSLLTSPPERFHRDVGEPLLAGERIVTPHFVVEILSVDANGPTRVSFELDRALESPDLVFLAWQGQGMARLEMPAVGQSMMLPWHPGALGLLPAAIRFARHSDE